MIKKPHIWLELTKDSLEHNLRNYKRLIGQVCMNLTMVDVTDIKNIQIGDEVILMGDHDNLRAHDLA